MAASQSRNLRFIYRAWLTCSLGIILAGITLVLGGVTRNELLGRPGWRSTTDNLALLNIGSAVVLLIVILCTTVSFCVLLYRLWTVVQDGKARTTPGAAVGYLFVPVYNVYWVFVATMGLAEELNRCAQHRQLGIKPANRTLMIAFCLLTLLGAIPFVGILASLINIGVAIAAFGSATNVAAALAQPEVGANAMAGRTSG